MAIGNDIESGERHTGSDSSIWQDLADRISTAYEAGDIDGAGELFFDLQRRSTPWLLRIAEERAPATMAEELVAQTHFGLFEMVHAGKRIDNVKALLRTILSRRIADAFRRGAATEVASASEPSIEDEIKGLPAADAEDTFEQVERRETARSVANTILDALPEKERAVLVARHRDGLSVAQTTARLALTEDQVKKCCQSAVKLASEITEKRGLRNDIAWL